MNDRHFSLQPFPTTKPLPNLKLVGKIARRDRLLTIHYALLGSLEELAIPAPVDTPTRKHELWQETCFEFFIGIENSQQYWEFNLSPSGDWNVYRFEAYRQGMQEEMAFKSLPFSVEDRADVLLLSLEMDLNKIVPIDRSVETAISAVIKPREGEVTYWALTHRGSQADFHRRDSFIIEL